LPMEKHEIRYSKLSIKSTWQKVLLIFIFFFFFVLHTLKVEIINISRAIPSFSSWKLRATALENCFYNEVQDFVFKIL
jgi:hypothetical protein